MSNLQHFPNLEMHVSKVPSMLLQPRNLEIHWSIETTGKDGKLQKQEGECKSFLRNFANYIFELFSSTKTSHNTHTYSIYEMISRAGGTYNPSYSIPGYIPGWWNWLSAYGFYFSTSLPQIGYGTSAGAPSFGDGTFTFSGSATAVSTTITDTSSQYVYTVQASIIPPSSVTAKQIALVINKSMLYSDGNGGGTGALHTLIKDQISDFTITSGVAVTIKFTLTWNSSSSCYTKNFANIVRGILSGEDQTLKDSSNASKTLATAWSAPSAPSKYLLAPYKLIIEFGNSSTSPTLYDYNLPTSPVPATYVPTNIVKVDDGVTKLNWWTTSSYVAPSSTTLQDAGIWVRFFLGTNSSDVIDVLLARGVFSPVVLGVGDALNARFVHEIAV